jgi:hypothetical protein
MRGGEIGRGIDKKKEEMGEAGDHPLHTYYDEKRAVLLCGGETVKVV